MAIFLDRHDPPDEITAEHVAEMHQKDLEVQHKYGCRGFTYWFDEKRKSGFCLIEAPDRESLVKMHEHAHGAVPSHIIEVKEEFVESFLGRLEDPVNTSNDLPQIIDDSAFRVILLSKLNRVNYQKKSSDQDLILIQNFNSYLKESIEKWNGSIVKHSSCSLLSSFKIPSNAIECAYDIQDKFNTENSSFNSVYELNIGISCGEPVTEKENIFEDSITLARVLGETIEGQIVASSEFRSLFNAVNLNSEITLDKINSIAASDEKMLVNLIECIEKVWRNPDLKIEDIQTSLGLSKSQLYRKTKAISGHSPNKFIKEYRLKKAMELIKSKKGNVSEIAFETGFNSPAYFSKCFHSKFDFLPSLYINS